MSTIFVAERQVLIPLQILWMEFFIDLVTSVAFEREPPERDLMTRPPRHAERPLLTNGILAPHHRRRWRSRRSRPSW